MSLYASKEVLHGVYTNLAQLSYEAPQATSCGGKVYLDLRNADWIDSVTSFTMTQIPCIG